MKKNIFPHSLWLLFGFYYFNYVIMFLKWIGKVGNLGTLQPMGHLDYYPNGGNFQPGCDGLLHRASCSHNRARELFRDSLVSSCPKVGYECSDETSFQKVYLVIFIFLYIIFKENWIWIPTWQRTYITICIF